MFRVCGYMLHEKKQLFIGLTFIYGIGQTTALKICKELSLNPYDRIKNLPEELSVKLSKYINENYLIGNDLKKVVIENKKHYINLNCFRGKRLRLGLPCRGQRTKSNGKNAKKLIKV